MSDLPEPVEPLELRPGGALDVIATTAERYRVKLDARSVLLGFLIGREWPMLQPTRDGDVLDGTKLREWLERYFEATGRKRRKPRAS